MHLSDALKILRDHEADLKKMGVRRLFVFGSTARGEQRPDSDVDLFFDDDGDIDLIDLIDIQDVAAELLGCKADIMTRDSIHTLIRPSAEAEAIPVF